MYAVKEIYYTIQGEGFHTGRAAVFCRFSGCNLWTGLEKNRSEAICQFCDTDFHGIDGKNGGKYTAEGLVNKCLDQWPNPNVDPFIVFTGGEPALQLDDKLIDRFHKYSCFLAVETNGTIELPKEIDWICVSPKSGTTIVTTTGNELKLVYPQHNLDPKSFETLNFENFYLQPLDCLDKALNTSKTIEFCLAYPLWKISIQSHKLLGIP